jgi:hypothetical protein
MAEPIVKKFVIDTTESEQNLKELNVKINATIATINNASQSFNLNTTESEQNIEELNAQVKDLGDQLKQIPNDIPKGGIPAEIVPAETIENTKSLKAQLRELQVELAATDPDSEKYRELASAAGELKDQIGDAAEAVGTQAGGAFEKVSGSLGLFTGRLANLDFEGAAEGAQLLGQNISEVKFSDVTDGIKATSKSFITLGKALLTNPLFLLTTVIGAIITNFDTLKNVIPGLGAVMEVIGEVVSFITDGVKSLSDAILGTEFIANDALNNSIAARDAALKELDKQEKRAVANAKKNGESVTAVEEKYANERIKTYQDIIDQAAYLTSQGIKLTEDQIKGVEEANAALFDIETQQIQKQAEVAEQARKTEEKRLADIEKKRDDAAKKAQERANKIKAQEQEVADAIKASKEEQFQATLSAEEKELRAVAVKYNQLKEKAGANAELQKQLREQELGDLQVISDKYFQQRLDTELANQIKIDEAKLAAEKAYQENLQQLQEETFIATLSEQDKEELAISQKYDKLFELAQGNRDREKEVTDLQEAELNIIREKYRKEDQQKADEKAKEDKEKADAKAQEDLEREQSIADAKIAITQQSLGAISAFIGAIAKKDEASQKRAFRAQKAVSIAQATIDTYASANAAFLSTQKNPVSILFPAAPYIAAGAAIAAGIANVATIAKQEFTGGTPTETSENNPPSLDGGGGGGGADTAQFNPFASAFLQDRPEQVTPRAYVLAGDVASQQEVRVKVEDLSRIG